MKKTSLISFSTALLVPVIALAQNTTYVDNWIDNLKGWLSTAITIIMVLMTIWFLISVFRYISEKDPGKLPDRRKTMLNGLIGLFVAVSVWGIINIAGNILGTDANNDVPNLQCPPGSISLGGRCVIR